MDLSMANKLMALAMITMGACSSADPPGPSCACEPGERCVVVPETTMGCMLLGKCFTDWYCVPEGSAER